MADTDSSAPHQHRRTWRQWSKLARVRIGFVMMLIVAISVFTVWWPRRGVLAVVLRGGDVYDPQVDKQIQSLQSRVPVGVWSVIGPWIEPRACWLATDARVENVVLVNETPAGMTIPVGIRLKHLRRFPRLSGASLHADQVGPALDELAEIKTLTSVFVYQLQATDHLCDLSRLPYIEEVVVGVCPATGGGWKGLREMPRLRKIRINLPASSEALAEVGQIQLLEELCLGFGVLQDDDLRLLSGLGKLCDLQLPHENVVGAAGLKHIARIPSLMRLSLSECSATDDEFQVLAELHQLKWLSIRYTNQTSDGIDRLKAALPNCEIDAQERPVRRPPNFVEKFDAN